MRQRLRGGGPNLNAMAFSPDGKKLAMWDIYDRAWSTLVSVGDFASGSVAMLDHHNRIFHLDWSPSGNVLAVGTPDGVHLWDMAAQPAPARQSAGRPGDNVRREIQPRRGPAGEHELGRDHPPVECSLRRAIGADLLLREALQLSPDDRMLAISCGNGRHVLAEIAPGRERRTFAAPQGTLERQVAFSPDGTLMACGGQGRRPLLEPQCRRFHYGPARGSADRKLRAIDCLSSRWQKRAGQLQWRPLANARHATPRASTDWA